MKEAVQQKKFQRLTEQYFAEKAKQAKGEIKAKRPHEEPLPQRPGLDKKRKKRNTKPWIPERDVNQGCPGYLHRRNGKGELHS